MAGGWGSGSCGCVCVCTKRIFQFVSFAFGVRLFFGTCSLGAVVLIVQTEPSTECSMASRPSHVHRVTKFVPAFTLFSVSKGPRFSIHIRSIESESFPGVIYLKCIQIVLNFNQKKQKITKKHPKIFLKIILHQNKFFFKFYWRHCVEAFALHMTLRLSNVSVSLQIGLPR